MVVARAPNRPVRRGTRAAALLIAGAAASMVMIGCHHRQPDQEERKRALLKPPDVKSEQAEDERKRQVIDPDGDLLPSDQIVAGVVLPRGLRLRSSSSAPPEWTYLARDVPAAAIERYFTARFSSSELTRKLDGMVTFDLAQPKDDPKAPPITLRITRLLGGANINEVYIRQTVPGRERPSAVEAEAKMRQLHQQSD